MSDTISKFNALLKPSGTFDGFTWQINTWSQLSEGITAIRSAVFVQEQSLSQEDSFDTYDVEAVQMLVCTDQEEPVATARMTKESAGVSRISYLGVLLAYRGNGLAKLMLNQLADFSRRRRDRLLICYVPTYVAGFFKRQGYETFGEPLTIANIAHVKMQLIL